MIVEPSTPSGADPWTVARVYYPAGSYRHPPAGMLQLRVVRRGSSYADIDLGVGVRRVFTRPGDLLLSLADRPTAFQIEDGRELTLVQVELSYLDVLLSALGANVDELLPLLVKPARDPLVAELCRRLEESGEDTPAYRDWAIGVVFGNLLRQARSLAGRIDSGVLSYRRLAPVLEAIDRELDKPLSVDTLAASIGFPRRVFGAAFRQATGLPVHQYILRRRAERAVELLTSTDLTFAEVAVRSGFAHQAHMSRVLRRLKGRTPGQIRAMVSSANSF